MLLKQHIEAEQYMLSVPEEWDVTWLAGDGLSFQQAGQHIGTLRARPYFRGLTLSDLVPRGAQILALRLIDEVPFGFELQVQVELNDRADEQASEQQTHFYYLMSTERIAYDLHLQIEIVGRQVALAVAKSLLYKAAGDNDHNDNDPIEKRHR